MPALPVGPSPSFQAVAFFRAVTSPNEVEPDFMFTLRTLLGSGKSTSLLIGLLQLFVKEKGTAIPIWLGARDGTPGFALGLARSFLIFLLRAGRPRSQGNQPARSSRGALGS